MQRWKKLGLQSVSCRFLGWQWGCKEEIVWRTADDTLEGSGVLVPTAKLFSRKASYSSYTAQSTNLSLTLVHFFFQQTFTRAMLTTAHTCSAHNLAWTYLPLASWLLMMSSPRLSISSSVQLSLPFILKQNKNQHADDICRLYWFTFWYEILNNRKKRQEHLGITKTSTSESNIMLFLWQDRLLFKASAYRFPRIQVPSKSFTSPCISTLLAV